MCSSLSAPGSNAWRAIQIGVALALAWLGPATVDAYPTRAIDLYIGSAPSGSTDALGRVLARALSEIIEQPVIVHNTPGAGGAVMATLLLSRPPDGYSLGMTISHAYTGNPVVMPEVTNYAVDDFTHLASVSKGQCALVTHASQPYETLDDLIATAKRGTQPVYASQSPLTRIVADYIGRVADVDFKVITVQGGGEIMQTILGRHADFGFSGGPHIDFVASGQMRVLASVEDERLVTSPDVPTLRELGYDISSCSMFVVSAPPRLPGEIKQVLSAALEQAIRSPAMTTLIRNLKYPEYYLGPEEVSRALRDEAQMLTRAVARIEDTADPAANAELSPAFMPYVAGALLLGALSLLLIGRLAKQGSGPTDPVLPRDSWVFVGAATAVLLVSFVTMNVLGYLPGAAAIVAGFMALGRADLRAVLIMAIAFPVVVWLLFSGLLGFPLP